MAMVIVARKYGLLFYWLAFVAITFYEAQFPGAWALPEKWRYPWMDAVVVASVLSLFVGILHLILRPMSYQRSWGRLASAWLYCGGLCLTGVASFATDEPGYYYVFAEFALVTFALMSAFTMIQLIALAWRRITHAT